MGAAGTAAGGAETHPHGHTGPHRASVLLLVLAFLALYFFWGSTYLGIKWAIEGFPPFFMAGVRNLIAGVVLYGWIRWRQAGSRAAAPTPRQWANAALVGGLLLLGGNGLVTMATQWIPSSLVALMVSMLPIWMAILEPVHNRFVGVQRGGMSSRVSGLQWVGIVLGFAGVAMLIGPKVLAAFDGRDHPGGVGQAVGAIATVLSSFCWANGSLYSRRADLPASAFLSTGMQLLCGGALLLTVSLAVGEFSQLSADRMLASWRPIAALVYLIVAGSLIGFTAYIWLIGVVSPSKVATYAYINPIVAVVLGWWLGNEELTWRILLAAAVIISGVVIIVTLKGRKPPGVPASAEPPLPAGGTLAVPVAADFPTQQTSAETDAQPSQHAASAGIAPGAVARR